MIEITTGWINLNTACNNCCFWCYRRDDIESLPQIMDYHMAELLIDFFAGLGIISCIFIGGEPTLYSGLFGLIKRAKLKGISETTIVTNGRLLKDERIVSKLSESGLDVFSVSIHSAFKEIHNTICRRQSWDETVAGIRNILKADKFCSLNLVVGKQNLGSIEESLPIFVDWGVQQIIVSCALPCITGEGIDGDNALDPKEFAKLIEKIANISSKVVILHELPLCLISRSTFLRLVKEKRLGYGCHIGVEKGLIIDTDGSIIPCNSFSNYSVANMFKGKQLAYSSDEFMDFWRKSETMLALRREANVKRSNICKKCNLWEICNCGCPITWGFFEPDNYINDSLQDIFLESIL